MTDSAPLSAAVLRLIEETDYSTVIGMHENPAKTVHHHINILCSYIHQLESENSQLRQLIPLVPTVTFGCHGDKCRLGVCNSCNNEGYAEEQASKAKALVDSFSLPTHSK